MVQGVPRIFHSSPWHARLFSAVIFAVLLSGCVSSPDERPEEPPRTLFHIPTAKRGVLQLSPPPRHTCPGFAISWAVWREGVPSKFQGTLLARCARFLAGEVASLLVLVDERVLCGIPSERGRSFASRCARNLPADAETLKIILKRSPTAGASSKTVQSIRAGAELTGNFMRRWDARGREMWDIMPLSHAAYNSGEGNLLKAQKLSGNKRDWPEISPFYPMVTGKHSKETIQYVERIEAAHKMLGGRPWPYQTGR